MSDSCVYVKDKTEAWLPATILSQHGDKVQVKVFPVEGGTEEGTVREISLGDYSSKALPLQNVDPSGHLMEMADMVDLPSLHEVRFACCSCCSCYYIYSYNMD